MKKVYAFIVTIICISALVTSCKKATGFNDPLVAPGPGITHPDSTIIELVVPSGITGTMKMVGDMRGDWPIGWQPGDNTSSLVMTNAGTGLYRVQVAISWFVKDNMEYKFVNGDAWGKEEYNIPTTAPNTVASSGNRSVKKSDLKGKIIRYTAAAFH